MRYISIYILLISLIASRVHATNGMNLEAYGATANGLGGASMAYDNGSAAVMNNPTTLILQETPNLVDVALGFLGPDVSVTLPGGMKSNSGGDAYWMPSGAYIKNTGNSAFGFCIFAQGGMGTEFDTNSFLGAGSGKPTRSEVSVGRLIIPYAWRVNEKLSLSVTGDVVWAGMDLQMAMSGMQFADLTTPGMQNSGTAGGSLLEGMAPFLMAGYGLDYAYFDFSNDNKFTGEARGIGYAAKVGLLYEASEDLTLGLVYHSETEIGNLDTDNAAVSFKLSNATPPSGFPPEFPATVTGSIDVIDFQWPATLGGGFAYDFGEKWMWATDIKIIQWSKVMKDFKMSFLADQNASNDMTQMGGPDMRGRTLDATLFQNWDDQFVFATGVAYKANDKWTLRAGINHAENPIPGQYVNPLFPAIIETHYTGGFGYKIDNKSSLNFAITVGDKKTVDTPTPFGPMSSSHGQFNWQLMYTKAW